MSVFSAWIITTGSGLAVLYGLYPHNYISPDAHPLPLAWTVIYGMFNRATWAACVGWIVLSCHWGYGGKLSDKYIIKV